MFCVRTSNVPHLCYEGHVKALLIPYGHKKPIAMETIDGRWVVKRNGRFETIGYRTPIWQDMYIEWDSPCFRFKEWIRYNPAACFNIAFFIIAALTVALIIVKSKLYI